MIGVNTVKMVRNILLVFFFSSRRRHTRLQGDWSSDVCSSDLGEPEDPILDDGARGDVSCKLRQCARRGAARGGLARRAPWPWARFLRVPALSRDRESVV